MIDEIIAAVKNARIDEPINELLFNETHFDCTNDLIFFIKPEITLADDKIKLEEILEMIFEKIECYNFKIKNIRIINAAYLEKHNIIAQHYGVINKLSKDINNSITAEGRAKFETIFGINFNKAEVLGSLEFIEKYPHFTATGLSYLWQNAATEKLAGGTYAQKLSLDGKDVYLINGFHPRQLEHFIAKGKTIITMTLTGNTAWKVARNSFIGKTDPEQAEAGSIRNELLANKASFGLQSVSSSWNGVHLSAGPIEGLVELVRYNSDFENDLPDSIMNYKLGVKLTEILGEKTALRLLENPLVKANDKTESVFDLTEELDSENCVELLKGIEIL